MEKNLFLSSDYVTTTCVFLQAIRAALAAEESSLTQYRILKWLFQHDELSSKEVAKRSRYSAATVSTELSNLEKRGLVERHGTVDRRVSLWRLTSTGLSVYRTLDSAASDAANTMLSLLPPELRGVFESSSIATSLEVDRITTRGLGYDYHSACLETMFEVELTYTQSLHSTGIGITDFRILFEIRTNPGSTASSVCSRLMLQKSTVSESLRKLVGSGLIERKVEALDKRSRRLFLTEAGSTVCETYLERIDDALTKGIRKVTREELSAWRELATAFVTKYGSLNEKGAIPQPRNRPHTQS